MGLVISVAPTIEPVTLAEAKAHLRLDTGTFADEIASTICIAPNAWPITASFGIIGTGVDVLNKSALVQISTGTVGTGATLAAKIQESINNSTWTDWTGGTFTTITAAGTSEKQYTGVKQYIRVVGTVAVDAIDFGVSVITGNYMTSDDTYISSLITAAREICEAYQARSYITRTYELTLDRWPNTSELKLPMPPAVAISSIVSTLADATTSTWDSDEYELDASGFVGRLSPAYGYSWPSDTLKELAGIKITYTAGCGLTAATVSNRAKQAIMILVGELYENREDTDKMQAYKMPWGVEALLSLDKVYSI